MVRTFYFFFFCLLSLPISAQNCDYNDCDASECGAYGSISWEAVEFLCQNEIIDDSNNINPENLIIREDVAKIIFKGLYGSNENPLDYDAGLFPTPYFDLQQYGGTYHDYARVLCYLEYGDGVSVFDRNFMYFNPGGYIRRAYFLKALLEAWDVSPDFSGTSPFDDIDEDAPEWGYIHKAYDLGIITGFNQNGNFVSGAYDNITREQAFLMLYRIMEEANVSSPSQSQLENINNYFVSYNFTPLNSFRALGVSEGSFPHYAKSTFNIPDIKFSLSFTHQYNSYVTQLPKAFYPIEPLGRGWSHSYNHYIVMEEDPLLNASNYAIIHPDGSMNIYRDFDFGSANDGYITLGVYDDFDRNGDIITITTKHQIEYRYEKIDNDKNIFYLTRIEDRNGNHLEIEYESAEADDLERIDYVEVPSGKRLYFFYHNGTDLLRKVEDPIGRDIEFTYDSDDRLKYFYDAKDNQTRYYYNAGNDYWEENLLTKIRLPEGNEIQADYDNQRKLAQFWTNNDPPSTIDVGDYNENSFNNFQSVSITTPMPDGGTLDTNIQYNQNGLPTEVSNDLGLVTHDFPSGGTHPTLPDESNLNGVVVHYDYDNKGNIEVITKEHPDGDIVQTFDWNADNDLYKYIDPLGNETRFYYTAEGNLYKIRDALLNETHISYNSYGQIIEIENPEDIVSTFTYFTSGDNKGMLQESRIENGSNDIVSTFAYDPVNRIESVDNNGLISQISYDDNDNVIQEIDPVNQSTFYFYDLNDNLEKLTNKRGFDTFFAYDNLDRLINIDFESLNKHYDYNDEGYLETYTKPSGAEIEYGYTPEGLLNNTSTIDDIDYDVRNRMDFISNDYGDLTFEYDEVNRLVEVKNEETNNRVLYEYDVASNIVEINYPETGIDAAYTYDAKNRITNVYANDFDGQDVLLAEYQYLADDRIDRIDYGNDMYIQYDYDNAGRLTEISHYDADNNLLAKYQYTLNARGNITEEDIIQPFTITPNLQNGTTSYAYDSTNQITQIDGQSVNVDDDGRTTLKPNTTYTYDLDDRLIEINTLEFTAEYEYDALGFRRTATRNEETPVIYEWDVKGIGNILVAKQGSQEHYYFYGPTGLIARIDNDDNLRYYHGDIRGSVTFMTDEDGAITHQYGYDDFGNLVHSVEEDENHFRYVGLHGVQYEHEDLQFMRARYYDSSIGRFLSEDPIWSQNLYPYAGNNPIGYNDPSGQIPWSNETRINGIKNHFSSQTTSTASNTNYCPANSTPTISEWNPTPPEAWNIFYQQRKEDIHDFVELTSTAIQVYAFVQTASVSSTISTASHGLQFTTHGLSRIAGHNATRQGVLSIDEIITTRSIGKVLTQSDGATVYINQIASGKFNVVVEGSLGIITTHRHFSLKAIYRLINRYGWK